MPSKGDVRRPRVTEEANLLRELEIARATIAGQAAEITRLREQAEQTETEECLRQVVQLGDIVGATIGEAPYRSLLDGITTVARHLFNARAASIMLLDRENGELVFEASTDRGATGILGMRFPADQGIAGWVVMTGEPIAVGDVRGHPRFAQRIAESTGYVPKSILAVPLIVGDDVEGVLEVLDKRDGTSFGLNDIDLLSLFARPAALAVEQTRLVSGIGTLLVEELARLAGGRGQVELQRIVQRAIHRDGPLTDDAMELARLVHAIACRGEQERRLTADLLTGVSRYFGPHSHT